MAERIGRRITLAEQIGARRLGGIKNQPYRDRPLAVEMTTPRGNLARAADIFPAQPDLFYGNDALRLAALTARVDNYYAARRTGKKTEIPGLGDLGTVVDLVRYPGPFLCHSALLLDPQKTSRWAKDLLAACSAHYSGPRVSEELGDATAAALQQRFMATVLNHEFGLSGTDDALLVGGRIACGKVELFHGYNEGEGKAPVRFAGVTAGPKVSGILLEADKTGSTFVQLFWFHPRLHYGADD